MSMTWENYQAKVLADAKELLEMDLSDFYYDHDGNFEDIYNDEIADNENVTGRNCNEYMGDYSDPAENVGAVFFNPTVQNWFADYGYDQFYLPVNAAEIDSMVRYFALESQYSELKEYYEQLLDEKQDELAIGFIMQHSNLCYLNAKHALEYLSDATDGTWMELACNYAHHLHELTYTDEIEPWMKDHPNDTVIDSAYKYASAIILSDQYMGR